MYFFPLTTQNAHKISKQNAKIQISEKLRKKAIESYQS